VKGAGGCEGSGEGWGKGLGAVWENLNRPPPFIDHSPHDQEKMKTQQAGVETTQ
jgi:hypothetical protein